LQIPFEPLLAGRKLNLHLILEYIAFFTAYRYYLYERQQANDPISTSNRLSIIIGAAIGAFLGSRLIGFLEKPTITITCEKFLQLLQVKTVMGGLFGGLLGVEVMKWKLGEEKSSGDLFTLPIILGIFIGRIGCFLSGTNEFTYGTITSAFTGMDLGDGHLRHPLTLYELIFLIVLFFTIRTIRFRIPLKAGSLFQFFMISYFGFRFLLEFLKPNTFLPLGLSSIQWLCIVCFIYYYKTILRIN